MTEYRASFDGVVRFSNDGDLSVHGFRVDLPSSDVDEAEIAALFVASLGLLMTESVELSNVEVFAQAHKGTRGGPSDRTAGSTRAEGRLVELSHVIRAGTVTYPGLPGPTLTPHLTHLDAPYHRYPDGPDLSTLVLGQTVDLPAVVARVTGSSHRGIDVGALAALDVRGAAVLLHTGDSARFGTPRYIAEQHFLTVDAADWLVRHGAALVGIDAVNIDDIRDTSRPAHSQLLAAGIPVAEHLTGLDQLPPTGATFTASPLRIEALGSMPVRAFARLPSIESSLPIEKRAAHRGDE